MSSLLTNFFDTFIPGFSDCLRIRFYLAWSLGFLNFCVMHFRVPKSVEKNLLRLTETKSLNSHLVVKKKRVFIISYSEVLFFSFKFRGALWKFLKIPVNLSCTQLDTQNIHQTGDDESFRSFAGISPVAGFCFRDENGKNVGNETKYTYALATYQRENWSSVAWGRNSTTAVSTAEC